MATTRPASAKALSHNATSELDIYAAEFAKLVDRYTPSRSDTPSEWLGRLPDEVFRYYQKGVSTSGSEARAPIERRGRLYLIHTALLFMWVSWGKEKARERFQCQANQSTRRAASLVTLEHYRRAGVLADYEPADWFFQPVGEWTVSLVSEAVEIERVADEALRELLRGGATVTCPVGIFAGLRASGAVPSRESLVL